ncbi:MAG: glycosyltransferase family 2 protein [Candidatus Sericytochromatia bacterium]
MENTLQGNLTELKSKNECYISIVAPAYNESENIYPFYERMKKVLDSITDDWEIVCVNDGSKDDTVEKLIDLNSKDNRVKVVDLSRNFGKELALTAGLDYSKGKAIIPIDIDLQDPPELIKDMIELWKQGNDVVYATRIKREGESAIKKTTAYLFYKLINKMTRINIPQNTGDFRLIDRRVLDSLKELKETHRFMKGLFSWVGYKQVSLPYVREPRFAGTTKFNYWKLWNFAIEGITSFSIVPLQLATYLGFFISLIAAFYAIVIIYKTLSHGADVPGYPSIMVTVLFFGGIQLITIGIIGEYVGRIYNEVKGRPLYLVNRNYD